MSEVSQPNEQLIEDAVAALVAFEGSESAEEILITVRVIHVHSVLWLRALLEENKRLNQSIEHWAHCYSKLSESKQRLIKQIQNGEEINFVTLDGSELQQTREELKGCEYWHKKRMEEVESLRTELSSKDKVLELYASEDMYTVLHLGCSPMVMADRGGQARTILSQYGDTHD